MRAALFLAVVFLVFSWSVVAQELFVVHAHKHYVEKNFSSFRDNEFSRSLGKINDFFCDKNWESYWIYDTSLFPKLKFPLKRCGAKKLKSKWGDISHLSYKFNYQNQVVLTGLYLGNCLSRTYRSIYQRFLRDQQAELNVHIPLPATVSFYSGLLDKGIHSMLENNDFLLRHYLDNKNLKLRTDIFYNGVLVKQFLPRVNPLTEKSIKLNFWGELETFMSAMERF
jgi:hypothetical protein